MKPVSLSLPFPCQCSLTFLELVLALIRPLKFPASSHDAGVYSDTLELVLKCFTHISCRAGGLCIQSPSVVLLLLRGCYCRSPVPVWSSWTGAPSAATCWGHLHGPESFDQGTWVVGTACCAWPAHPIVLLAPRTQL